jgi:hypothetical protein
MLCLLATAPAFAWGPDGHRVVGFLATREMSWEARARLRDILGTDDPVAAAESCNWPDQYRATDEGAWSAPLHYVNVPAGADDYDRRRDCPGGACSAEAIKRFAAELGNERLPPQRRRQAWAWVCHLAADIHQPMHSGYRHDRGGNDVPVEFMGRDMNLHAFWDHALIELNYTDWTRLAADLKPLLPPVEAHAWRPENADRWVRESHGLLRQSGYPDSEHISREFAAAGWLLARRQLALAATRLAALANAELGGQSR